MEAVDAVIKFARDTGVGYWEVIAGVAFLILAGRSPELLKIGGEFFNERKRINDALRLKQDQVRRSIDAAQARRKQKEGQRK